MPATLALPLNVAHLDAFVWAGIGIATILTSLPLPLGQQVDTRGGQGQLSEPLRQLHPAPLRRGFQSAFLLKRDAHSNDITFGRFLPGSLSHGESVICFCSHFQQRF